MKVVFLSNYFNHHQKPISDVLSKICDYYFIATDTISNDRISLGYEKLSAQYVVDMTEEKTDVQFIEQLVCNADVVIAGSTPEYLLRKRKQSGKLIFRYSERPVKGEKQCFRYIARLLKWNLKNTPRKNIYLLSASAYAPYEYGKFLLFRGRAFKWGYFTEVKKYSKGYKTLECRKKTNSILWVARMITLKHPEAVINVAERLVSEGYSFTVNMVGKGSLEGEISALVSEKKLDDTVFLKGAMRPEDVRSEMERSEIFLFTSDINEGWGAVLNEAMNSGCAVIASHEIGAVPYLIQNGKNGFVYRDGDLDDLYLKTKKLLDDNELRCRLAKGAYKTMVDEWTPQNAAERLINVSESILSGNRHPDLYSTGPCSKAEIIRDDWFEHEIKNNKKNNCSFTCE